MSDQSRVKTELNERERRFGSLSLIGLLFIIIMFSIISIDSAIIAQGQVVVQGNPRPVQSLEGGRVSSIHVRDGDEVAAGQVLIELDPTLLLINRDIVHGRLAELVARKVRLEAEQQQLDQFPPFKVESYLDAEAVRQQLAGQHDLFLSRRSVLESKTAQLEERKRQHEAQITGLEAQIKANREQAGLISQEVANLEILLKQGLVQESRLLELQGRKAGLLGQIAQHQSEIARMRNAIRDADLETTQTEREFREEVVLETREVLGKISENQLELARIEEQLQQLDIRAPVSGVVHELQVWTSQGVIAPQETLMTVVPVSEGVEFEVQVAPDAIDTVYLGQKARLRFPAFDQRTTPELSGNISGIAPDSVTDPATGRTFYRVDVALTTEELARLDQAKLIPGMPLEVFLQTGDRSILNFLVKPLVDQLAYTFRES